MRPPGGNANRIPSPATAGEFLPRPCRPRFPGSNVQWNFQINPASQIASETRDNDGYAFAGIPTATKAYAVNGLNQYTAVAGTAHTYDANGNLTGDGVSAYIYDGENRLVSATAAGVTTTLTYDPLGRLWQVVKGAANTRFLTDGDAIVAEYNAAGALTNRYVHGSNIADDDPLLWYVGSGTGTKRYLHADHLGSIVAATNAAAAPTINAYDEYGVPKATNVGRFQYTGQAWLSELGLYHYKARLYSPSLGRFLQVDPVGYKDQINLYAYVADDPVNATDPRGLDTIVTLFARPIEGLTGWLGYEHQYVYMVDTDSGDAWISRAGPSAAYTGGSSDASNDAPANDESGRPVTLVTELRPAAQSSESNPKTGLPIGHLVPGSVARVKEPIRNVVGRTQKLNNAIDNAKIPYRPKTTNSNAYAGTAYRSATGRNSPASANRPGSNIDLRNGAMCRGTRIGNQDTGSIC